MSSSNVSINSSAILFPALQGSETLCGSIASTQSSPLAAVLGASVKIWVRYVIHNHRKQV